MANNKTLGNKFEERFCKELADNGYWVHRMQQNIQGQPADVIAAKNGRTFLIDCKLTISNRFPFSRVENNQRFAMRKWRNAWNGDGWFAIQLADQSVYMIPLASIERHEQYQASFGEDDIRMFPSFEEWVNKWE